MNKSRAVNGSSEAKISASNALHCLLRSSVRKYGVFVAAIDSVNSWIDKILIFLE